MNVTARHNDICFQVQKVNTRGSRGSDDEIGGSSR